MATGPSTTQATFRIECSTNTVISLLDEVSVKLCIGINAGTGAGSSVTERYLGHQAAPEDKLAFQMSRNPAGTLNWGDAPGSWHEMEIKYPLRGFIFGRTGHGEGYFTVHGRVPQQTDLSAGRYDSTLTSRLQYRYRELYSASEPENCNTGGGTAGSTDTFVFQSIAEVPGSCTIQGATDLNFGTLMSTSTGLLEETSTISMTCTRRTAWQVGLDDGLHANGNTRRLHNSGAYIAYELNRTAGWDRWGDTLNSDTVTGTGTGTVEQLTVHGRITNQPLTRAGRYSDTIKVVVTY